MSRPPRTLPRSAVLKLTLLVAVIVAVLLGALLTAGHRFWREVLREQIDARLSSVAESRLHMVRAEIALHRQRVALNADRGEFRGFLEQLAAGTGSEKNRDISEHSLKRIAADGLVRSAVLVDPSGSIVAASDPREFGRSLAGDPTFIHGLREIHISVPQRAADRFEVRVAGPVRSFAPRETVCGALVMDVDVMVLAHALRDTTGLGQTGEAVLGVREDGKVRFLFPPRYRNEIFTAPLTDVPPMAAATEGRDFLDRSHDYRGKPVLAAGHPIGYGGWGLVVKMDEAEAYAPITRAMRYSLGLGAIIVMVGLAAAYGLARQSLTVRDGGETIRRGGGLGRMATVCALAVLLIGFMVLTGWALNIGTLKSMLPGLATMKPNTALCFALGGAALMLRQRDGFRLGCAVVMIAFGAVSLTQDVTGADFGIDQFLFRDTSVAARTVKPGRMPPMTAVNFMLMGGSVLLLGTRRTAHRRVMELLALLAGSAALLALIGYAYCTEALYRFSGFGNFALPTSVAFVLLTLGVLCVHADGFAGVFASTCLGGQVARRFLPLAIVTPLVLGWLALLGEEIGLFDAPQTMTVLISSMVLVLAVLVWWNALSLEASDAKRTKAEEKLRLSHGAVQAAANGIALIDRGGTIQWSNRAFCHMTGFDMEELVGRNPRLLKSGEHGPDFYQNLWQTILAGEVWQGELVNRRKNGSLYTEEMTITPLRNSDRKITHFIAVKQDVTERKRRERNLTFLADMQKRFSLLSSSTDILQQASERIAGHLQLDHCLLMEIDESAEDATVLHDHHAPGATGLAGVYRITDFQTDDERRELLAGRTVVIDDVRLDPRSAANVERFTALRIGAMVNAPYLADGRWKFLVSALRREPHEWPPEDTELLTELAARIYVRIEHARAEERLRATSEHFIATLAASPVITFSQDHDLRYTWIHNPALGFSAEEVLGKTDHDLFECPEDAERIDAIKRAVLTTGEPRREEIHVREKGAEVWYDLSAHPQRVDGSIVGVLCTAVEITSRKQAENQIRILNQELESRVVDRTAELRAAVAELEAEIAKRHRLEREILEISEREQCRLGQDLHDGLGQELAGIAMIGNVVATQLQTEDHPAAATASEIANYIRGTIDSARSLAKGLYPVELSRYGLIVALEDLAGQTSRRFGISCELRRNGHVPEFGKSIEIHIYRIVQECIGNAIKHGKASTIMIESLAGDGIHTFSVTDDGVGFEKPDNHTGMGLHLMDYRARVIGAEIGVEKPGKRGCRITCRLRV